MRHKKRKKRGRGREDKKGKGEKEWKRRQRREEMRYWNEIVTYQMYSGGCVGVKGRNKCTRSEGGIGCEEVRSARGTREKGEMKEVSE